LLYVDIRTKRREELAQTRHHHWWSWGVPHTQVMEWALWSKHKSWPKSTHFEHLYQPLQDDNFNKFDVDDVIW